MIPLGYFEDFWLAWSIIAGLAIGFNWQRMLVALVVAFLAVEFTAIRFTENDAGTLTDTTARHIPEDFTFILMGFMIWRLSHWVSARSEWAVFVLAAWLIQHFIRNYLRRYKP